MKRCYKAVFSNGATLYRETEREYRVASGYINRVTGEVKFESFSSKETASASPKTWGHVRGIVAYRMVGDIRGRKYREAYDAADLSDWVFEVVPVRVVERRGQ